MKKFLFVICFVSMCFFVQAQKTPKDILSEIILRNEDTTDNTPILQNIVEHYPHDSCFGLAAQMLSAELLEKGDTNESVRLSHEILKRPFRQGADYWNECDIIPNSPHHFACLNLSDFYFNRQDYDSALHYLFLADTVFRYQGICSRDAGSMWGKRRFLFAKIFFEKGESEKAKDYLFETILSKEWESDEEIQLMEQIFLKQGHFKKIQRDLENGLANIRRDTLVYGNIKIERPDFIIPFQGRNLIVYMAHLECWPDCADLIPRKIYPELFRKTKFYKMVMALGQK